MLPEKFKLRMMQMLGGDYPSFERALEDEEPVRGFRINKIKAEDTKSIADILAKEIVPYEKNAFVLKDGVAIGKSYLHHAGAVYMQDPGAMAALAALNIKDGIWAIDLCAAPGGKSSKIAEYIGDDGFLLSNEFVPKRAKTLVSNFERLGIKNAVVTSLDTAEFPKLFDGAFDLVVADVPCSGEGMFRKNSEALSEWSEENIRLCADRQREILENAAPLLKVGGVLVYSTCTFSAEENEEQIIDFLKRHPDFSLIPVKKELIPYTAPAVNIDGEHPELEICARRFYPHIAKGEGQFVALMQRFTSKDAQKGVIFRESIEAPSKSEAELVLNFLNEILEEIPQGRLVKQGESIALISHGGVLPPKSVFSAGVLVGDIRGKLFFPAHQLFSAYGRIFKNKLSLTNGDPRLEKYLLGEEIEIDPDIKGWCAVLADDIPLGGGKASSGRLKNHYPKGLRNKK